MNDGKAFPCRTKMALRTREAIGRISDHIPALMAKAVDSAPITRRLLPSSSTMASKTAPSGKHRSAATDFRHLRGFLADLMLAPRVVEVLYDLHETDAGPLYYQLFSALQSVYQK